VPICVTLQNDHYVIRGGASICDLEGPNWKKKKKKKKKKKSGPKLEKKKLGINF
jgi:hypothetical protein